MSYDPLNLAAPLQHPSNDNASQPPDFGVFTLRAAGDLARIFCHLRPSYPQQGRARPQNPFSLALLFPCLVKH
jgi:hypothetical protein